MTLDSAIVSILEGSSICSQMLECDMGALVFKSTSTPVYLILELLADGAKMSEILEEFPELTRRHIKAALYFSSELVLLAGTK